VTGGQGAALAAENAMLRLHISRQAAARKARRAPAGQPRQVWRPMDGYWWGGHAMAMREVIELASQVAERTASPGKALIAVCELAAGVIELRETFTVPAEWTGQ
jgi:hypothetical protein